VVYVRELEDVARRIVLADCLPMVFIPSLIWLQCVREIDLKLLATLSSSHSLLTLSAHVVLLYELSGLEQNHIGVERGFLVVNG
jgi:hypothetical protein